MPPDAGTFRAQGPRHRSRDAPWPRPLPPTQRPRRRRQTPSIARSAQAGREGFAVAFGLYYVDAKGHAQAKQALQDDANIAYELALAFRMTNDARYAQTAVPLINAWASQVQTLSKKDDSTLSFSYHFPPLIFAADLLKDCPDFKKEDQERFKSFVREKALPQNTMDRDNNWGNWGLLLVLSAASYLKDRELFDKGVARWKKLIENQIAEDGHLPHEVTRNGGRSGLWYSNFSLLPQTLCAEVARVNGVDLYDYQAPNGRTLKQAYEKLAPWTLKPETFPYWKGAAKELHGSDYVSYYELLILRWPNTDAEALLKSKRPLTASHGAPYVTFTHSGFTMDNTSGPAPKKGKPPLVLP
jgi:hypothetical protein